MKAKLSLKLLLGAAALSASLAVSAFDVEGKYNQACKACHLAGVAGAPKSFDPAAWKPRLELGMDALVSSVKNGKGAMPPRGLCMDCTDEQYKALIQYMSKAK